MRYRLDKAEMNSRTQIFWTKTSRLKTLKIGKTSANNCMQQCFIVSSITNIGMTHMGDEAREVRQSNKSTLKKNVF